MRCSTTPLPPAPFPAAPSGCSQVVPWCLKTRSAASPTTTMPQAVTPETVYDIASVTKVVATTAACMLLHQRGLLDLDMPLGELLPGLWWAVRPPNAPATSSFVICWRTIPACPAMWSCSAPPPPLRSCFAPAFNCRLRPSPAPAPNTPIPDSSCSARRSKCLTGERLAAWTRSEIFQPLGHDSNRFSPPLERQAQ